MKKSHSLASRLSAATVLMTLSSSMGPVPARAAPLLQYAVTDLGGYPGATGAGASLINAAGQIVVVNSFAPTHGRPSIDAILRPHIDTVIWQASRRRDLGRIEPRALNGRGWVVGYDAHGHIVVWSEGHTNRLALGPGALLGYGNCLNDRGWIAGQIRRQGSGVYAFLWDGTRTRRVSPPGALFARADAVNDRGQALVWAVPRSLHDQVFLWDRGRSTLVRGLPRCLPNLSPICLNGRGQAIIIANSARHTRSYLWQNGRLRRLRPPAGLSEEVAHCVNDRGQAVGEAHRSDQTRAILWDGGRGVDLNSYLPAGSGWKLLYAFGINEQGQIIGSGTYRGERDAFLLTPTSAATVTGRSFGKRHLPVDTDRSVK